MRKHSLMAAGLTGVLLVAALGLLAWTVTRVSFARLEREQARQSLARASRAIAQAQHQLEASALNYGTLWQETQAHHSFTREELDRLGIDIVWLAGSAGETTWQVAIDKDSPSGLRLIPPETLALLTRSFAPSAHPSASWEHRTGLLRTPRSLLLVAALPLLHADTPAGTLVLARSLDERFLSQLEPLSQSHLQLTLLDEHGPRALLPAAVMAWASTASDEDLLERGTAYTLLRGIDGTPLAILSSLPLSGDLVVARRLQGYCLLGLLAVVGGLLMVLLFLLERSGRERLAIRRELLEQERMLSRLTRRDSLTGLPNRTHLQRLLPHLLLRASRDGSLLALLYLDLDHFKHINETLGHTSGDRLLQAVARRLRSTLPRQDIVVRMGGDELVVVAGPLATPEAASTLASTIRAALAEPLTIDGVTLSMSSSIGISVYPTDATDPEQLLRQADLALHHAKDRGRGTHQFYLPEMNTRLHERLWLERSLRQALDGNELSVEYQPCFDLQTLRPVSLEALLRWRSPDGSYIPPSRFIPVAEQSNLIIEIGEWVLARVCQQLAAWQSEQVPLVPVSINISVRQFERTALASLATGLARQLGIDVHLLHFEITETAAMQSSQAHLSLLQSLRQQGSRILIDDFGTGYSSLSYLKNLPIDTLKIDRAFVRDMAVDASDAAIVRAIVEVAKSLGLMLVAEGIESAEQLEHLRGLGCQCGQGFYFSPAVSPDLCRGLLRQLRGPDPRLGAESLAAGQVRAELESGA